MGRFEPTGRVDVPGMEHSVAELPWGALRGAFGPSDGSAGARSNVPSALAVAAPAVHVAAIRAPYLAALSTATQLSPFAFLALLELGAAPGDSVRLATELLDDPSAHHVARAAAAAFLARFGDHTPSLHAR